MAILQDLIVSVRNLRAELKVEPKARLPIRVHAAADVRAMLERNREAIEKLAGVEGVSFVEQSLAQVANARSTARFDVALVYEKKIDTAAERERLRKELQKLEGESANARRQLGNEQFLAKAPAKVVEGLKARAAELDVLIQKARAALDALK
jgi:valyl-tRNA synthetase